MKTTILEKFGKNGYLIYRVPGIISTSRGTLLAYYDCRNGGDWSVTDLAVRRSEDGGKTWSPRRILVSSEGYMNLGGASMIADGEIVHFLWHRGCREVFHSESRDDGLAWSIPKNITYAFEALRPEFNWTVIANGPGHGIVLKNGRLLGAAWLARDITNTASHANSVITTIYSDDHGVSWRCGEILFPSRQFQNPSEASLAELSDGSVLINCRHTTPERRYRKLAASPDGISRWSHFHFDKNLRDPVCFGATAFHENHIWFVNCDSDTPEKRDNLTLRESADDARTWSRSCLITRDGGYSDLCFRPESGTLHVIGETGRANPKEHWTFGITVTTLSLSELLPCSHEKNTPGCTK